MSIAESLSTIDALVKALPEVYQPIFGHPEFSLSASRQSEDRLAHLVAIHDALAERLGRQVRVLDLGCAQGFFALSLAARGAIVHGVDFADANIAVCRALADEHPDLAVVFESARIEDVIPRLPAGSIDLVLGLSVFHHIVYQSGIASTRQLIASIAERAGVGVFEMALPSEPLYWAAAQPSDPRVLLSGYGHVYELARHGTHLSAVSRPLYMASIDSRPELAVMASEATSPPIGHVDPIASVQCRDDGTPRFHVRPFDDGSDWDAVAAREAGGGIEAETRLFLAMQLEPGDLFVDLAPGAGFVALAAATEPAAPHVLCVVDSEAQRAALAGAADEADVHIETVVHNATDGNALVRLVRERAILPHRIVVHADAAAVLQWGAPFAALAEGGDVLAWCVSGALHTGQRTAARAVLASSHFEARQLAEGNDGVVLVEAPTDADEYIAIHRSVLSEPSDDIFPVDTSDGSAQASIVSIQADASDDIAPPRAVSRWPAFHFIAPFCRTGYGITGAYILKSLAGLGAPVSFFPLGALDRTLFTFDGLDNALDRQDDFDPTMPSVRLSQQFDLAMHVGRGPRIGFPIFELNRFSARARHHLAAQDRLLVCSEWARGILLDNGLWRAPIHVVPLGVDRVMFNERIDRGPAREETVFLQVGKLEPRKGQRELLAAFEAAFTPSDKVRLVLACHNPFLSADAFAAATAPFRTSRMASRITLHGKPLPTHLDVARLMASADCGVFASRAEGWNLEALEMLSCGREVIATNYSAHTAFLTPENAHLVDIDELEDAPNFSGDRGAWAAWGPRQHEQLVEHLRAVHARRRQGPLPDSAAGLATAERLSWDNTAHHLLTAVQASMR